MKQVTCFTLLLFLSVFLAGPVWAQDPIIYPAKGQSEDQMEKDKYQCYSWAKNQTGFDPMKTPTTTSGPPAKEKEVWGAGKTGVAGGATGALVGGLAKGRKGAVRGGLIGAGTGALIGGARSSNQRKQEEQKRKEWEQREVNNYARARNEYNRALGACLEGRGYTVK
jgi:Glycine zipper